MELIALCSVANITSFARRSQFDSSPLQVRVEVSDVGLWDGTILYAPVGGEDESIISYEGGAVSIPKAPASGRPSISNVGWDVESIGFGVGESAGDSTTPSGGFASDSSTLVGGGVKLTRFSAKGAAVSDCIRVGDLLGTGAPVESASLNETGTIDGLGVVAPPPVNKSLVGRCVGFSVGASLKVGALLVTVEGVGGGGGESEDPLKPTRTVTKTAPIAAMHTKRKPTSNSIALLLNFLLSS